MAALYMGIFERCRNERMFTKFTIFRWNIVDGLESGFFLYGRGKNGDTCVKRSFRNLQWKELGKEKHNLSWWKCVRKSAPPMTSCGCSPVHHINRPPPPFTPSSPSIFHAAMKSSQNYQGPLAPTWEFVPSDSDTTSSPLLLHYWTDSRNLRV